MLSRSLCLFLLALSVAAAPPATHGALERGLQFFSDGRFSEAETSLREAVAADPDSFEAHLALGATLARLKRPVREQQ